MRYLLPAALAALLPQASAADVGAPQGAAIPAGQAPAFSAETACRKPEQANAQSGLAWRDGPIVPKKLTELPDAKAYMAVYRQVDGCEVPMSVAEYRERRP